MPTIQSDTDHLQLHLPSIQSDSDSGEPTGSVSDWIPSKYSCRNTLSDYLACLWVLRAVVVKMTPSLFIKNQSLIGNQIGWHAYFSFLGQEKFNELRITIS